MKIEYLPNLPATGGKIDLSTFKKKEKRQRPEDFLQIMLEKLRLQAKEVNHEFPNLLTESAQIEMIGPNAKSDEALIAQQETGFAALAHKDEEQWRRDRNNNPANLTEIALTILFHKFLKNDYIVARASVYDDYNNGVDLVLIDKKTGAIVCGFDEVITPFKEGNAPKKEEKLKRKMLAGGARLKYGAFINQGNLSRGPRHNLPAFYLALTKDELDNLLSDLAKESEAEGAGNEDNRQSEVSDNLKQLFLRLSSSLESQLRAFEKDKNLHPHLLDNLRIFQDSFFMSRAA